MFEWRVAVPDRWRVSRQAAFEWVDVQNPQGLVSKVWSGYWSHMPGSRASAACVNAACLDWFESQGLQFRVWIARLASLASLMLLLFIVCCVCIVPCPGRCDRCMGSCFAECDTKAQSSADVSRLFVMWLPGWQQALHLAVVWVHAEVSSRSKRS